LALVHSNINWYAGAATGMPTDHLECCYFGHAERGAEALSHAHQRGSAWQRAAFYRLRKQLACIHTHIHVHAHTYIHTIKKNAVSLVAAINETVLEVNADKTKYILTSPHQIAGRSHFIKNGNSSFEMVKMFKYLGTTLKNQNYVHEEIKSILKSGNAYYRSV